MPSLAQEPPAELLEKKRDRRVPKAPFPPATTTFPLRGAGGRPGGYGSTTGDIRPEKKQIYRPCTCDKATRTSFAQTRSRRLPTVAVSLTASVPASTSQKSTEPGTMESDAFGEQIRVAGLKGLRCNIRQRSISIGQNH
jgi:hypothetical protein